MALSVSNLIHKCGPELFGVYFQRRFHRDAPEIPGYKPDKYFGFRMEQELHDAVDREEAQKLLYDLYRVNILGDTDGLNCLRNAVAQRRQNFSTPSTCRSAFKQALFYMINQPDIFELAVHQRLASKFRFSRNFHDRFKLSNNLSLSTAKIDENFKRALEEWFYYRFGPDCSIGFDARIIQPLLPFNPLKELRILIHWGDDRDGLATFDHRGAGFIFPSKHRMICVAISPTDQSMTVFGRWLGKDDRKALGETVARTLFGSADLNPFIADTYDLSSLLYASHYSAPARLGIREAGLTSCLIVYPGSAQSDRLEIEFPLSFRQSRLKNFEARGLASPTRTLNETLTGARVISVAFQIIVEEPRIFSKGLTIRGTINRNAVIVENDLDVARHLVMEWVNHLRLRSDHAPLFGAIA